jgi:membrane-associated phospholipid phosphatase
MRTNVKLPLLAAVGCLIAFATLLGAAYAIAPTARWDAVALHGLMTLRGPFTDPIAHAFVHSADPLPLLFMLAIVFAAGWLGGRRWQAVGAILLVVVANVATQILKLALAHPRYQPVLGADQLGPEAFPSGHATAAMSIALAAVLVFPPRARAVITALAAAYVIAAVTSILVLAWHFPSDVAGGLLVASASFFGVVAALRAIASWSGRRVQRPSRRPRLSLGLTEAALVGMVGAATIGLSRAEDLLAFARLHTAAAAIALGIVATSCGLLASAALIADD